MEVLPLKEWWRLALTDTNAGAEAWENLTSADRKAVRKAVVRAARARTGSLNDEIMKVIGTIGKAVEEGDLEDLINSWGSGGPLSEHIELELAAAFYAGRRWKEGEPVGMESISSSGGVGSTR